MVRIGLDHGFPIEFWLECWERRWQSNLLVFLFGHFKTLSFSIPFLAVCSVSWRLLTIDTRTPSPKLNSTWHSCLTWNCAVPHTVPVLFCFICNFSFAFQFHDSTSSHDFVWLTVILHNQPDCDALRYFSHFHLFEITRELSVCRF